jgi:hypothetical protein
MVEISVFSGRPSLPASELRLLLIPSLIRSLQALPSQKQPYPPSVKMTQPKLDPRSLQNWEDAFKHSIADVRQMEQQLQLDIADNHEKLRTLVGYVGIDTLEAGLWNVTN